MLAREMVENHLMPQVIREHFVEICENGEYTLIPAENVGDAMLGEAEMTAEFHYKWFARFSAPGFLDCTDWKGPYRTEEGALWELYGEDDDEEETFFNFISEGHKIVGGSLELRGHRNELYGKVVGENVFGEPRLIHIATLGDIDSDDETGEIVTYDPNDDWEIGEAYGFELVDGDDLKELEDRVRNASLDTSSFKIVTMYAGYEKAYDEKLELKRENHWRAFYLNVPAEMDDEEAKEFSLTSLRDWLSAKAQGDHVFLGVMQISIEEYPWTEKAIKEGIVQ